MAFDRKFGKRDKIEAPAPATEHPTGRPELVAKKDFEIHHNDYHRVIKAGDVLTDVPAHYHPNLKTEGVI
jgi:hypothetical protein